MERENRTIRILILILLIGISLCSFFWIYEACTLSEQLKQEQERNVYDVNKDGEVNALDLLLVQKEIIKENS